jgi:hypothetical protein
VFIIGRYHAKLFAGKELDEDDERPSTLCVQHESEMASWQVVFKDDKGGSEMGRNHGEKVSKTRGGIRNGGRVWMMDARRERCEGNMMGTRQSV